MQNIDSLEHQAGLPEDAVVAAHGNFDSAKCIRCGRPHSINYVRKAVFETDGNPCYCEKQVWLGDGGRQTAATVVLARCVQRQQQRPSIGRLCCPV